MTSIAYLANQFPEPLEPYVWEEICELRRHDCWVMPCSFNRPQEPQPSLAEFSEETLYVFPLQLRQALSASWLCIWQFALIADLLWRAVRGPEVLSRRIRTVVHTWLGAYLATILRREKITHIHIHHGYFSAWVGMVASRFLGAGFSMTLHGSDLLVRADYLDSVAIRQLTRTRYLSIAWELIWRSGRHQNMNRRLIAFPSSAWGVFTRSRTMDSCFSHAER